LIESIGNFGNDLGIHTILQEEYNFVIESFFLNQHDPRGNDAYFKTIRDCPKTLPLYTTITHSPL